MSVEEAIGFRPQPYWTYDWWNLFFNKEFFLIKEEIKNLTVSDEESLKKEIECFVFEKSPYLRKLPKKSKKFVQKNYLKLEEF